MTDKLINKNEQRKPMFKNPKEENGKKRKKRTEENQVHKAERKTIDQRNEIW